MAVTAGGDAAVVAIAWTRADAQLVVAAAGLVLTSVLAWTTGWYAFLTRGMLRASLTDQEKRTFLQESEHARRVGAFSEFPGAEPSQVGPWFE